jgi:MoxR-like ATPase
MSADPGGSPGAAPAAAPPSAESIRALGERIAREGEFLRAAAREVERVLVGQKALVEGLLIGLLADGHVLVEGVPGLAKSLAVECVAAALGGTFRRIQFTPDLLPSDLLGTHVYNPATGAWTVREGPIFANVVLADEVNRAPAKVQSALLEAMQERQVSLAGETRPLPDPFLVLATQNPIELEGTYPLPEAQIDRFLFKLVVDFPDREDEKEIVRRMAATTGRPAVRRVAEPRQVIEARRLLDAVHLDPKVLDFVVDLVRATRRPAEFGLADLQPLVLYGASPRASIGLVRAARGRAFLEGRGFVTPQDVKAVGMAVLRHRVVATYEAEAERITSAEIVRRVFDAVPVP